MSGFLGDVSKLKITIESEDGLYKQEVKTSAAVINYLDDQRPMAHTIILGEDNIQQAAHLSAACHNASKEIVDAVHKSLKEKLESPRHPMEALKAQMELIIFPNIVMEAFKDYDRESGVSNQLFIYSKEKEEANAEGLQTKRAHID